MNIQKIRLFPFSPTGTTQAILQAIARGLGFDTCSHTSLTLSSQTEDTIAIGNDELALIGTPVYGGRLPASAIRRFRRMKAQGTPAVLVVLYGNRAFEDALLELKHLALELGFSPLAAGAFIGEHSFSTKAMPIAAGRPDHTDLQRAQEFGAIIARKISSLPSGEAISDLSVPGRFPFESSLKKLSIPPVTTKESCTRCGKCASACPAAAITVSDSAVTTRGNSCLYCCACIRSCPASARVCHDPAMKAISTRLHELFSSRQEPQLFGV